MLKCIILKQLKYRSKINKETIMMVQKFRREQWQEGGGLPPPSYANINIQLNLLFKSPLNAIHANMTNFCKTL